METDIKRLLAYSTVENVGIILIAVGTAMVFKSYGLNDFAALALIAALFHCLNHALFKGLLFMGAGAILHATHTRNMELLGGLAKKMPLTGVFFFVGALAISAIPPLNGFVSEWLIFQSLLLSSSFPEIAVKILMPFTVGMLALTGCAGGGVFRQGVRHHVPGDAQVGAGFEKRRRCPARCWRAWASPHYYACWPACSRPSSCRVIDSVTAPIVGASIASKAGIRAGAELGHAVILQRLAAGAGGAIVT